MTGLVITDLDGTILRADGSVPLASVRRLRDSVDRIGFDFCVATSRSIPNVLSLECLRPNWVIAHDGACTIELTAGDTRVLDERLLPPLTAMLLQDKARRLARSSKGQLVACAFYGANQRFRVCGLSDRAQVTPDIQEAFERLVSDGRELTWSLTEPADLGVRAVSLFGTEPAIDAAKRELDATEQTNVHSYPETRLTSGLAWLDIHSTTVGKGSALKRLRQHKHFDPIVAMGNGINDIDMLQLASMSIAPSDAVPDALAAATMCLDGASAGDAFSDAAAEWLLSSQQSLRPLMGT